MRQMAEEQGEVQGAPDEREPAGQRQDAPPKAGGWGIAPPAPAAMANNQGAFNAAAQAEGRPLQPPAPMQPPIAPVARPMPVMPQQGIAPQPGQPAPWMQNLGAQLAQRQQAFEQARQQWQQQRAQQAQRGHGQHRDWGWQQRFGGTTGRQG